MLEQFITGNNGSDGSDLRQRAQCQHDLACWPTSPSHEPMNVMRVLGNPGHSSFSFPNDLIQSWSTLITKMIIHKQNCLNIELTTVFERRFKLTDDFDFN